MDGNGFSKLRITLAATGTVLASLFGSVMRSARASTHLPIAYTASTRWRVQSSDCAAQLGVAGNHCGIGVREFTQPAQTVVTTSPGFPTSQPVIIAPSNPTTSNPTGGPTGSGSPPTGSGSPPTGSSPAPTDSSPAPTNNTDEDDRFSFVDGTDNTIAFERSLGLAVAGNIFTAPSGKIDLTGNTLLAGPQSLAGLDVEVQYQFIGSSDITRAVYTFHNRNEFSVSVPLNTNIGGYGAGAQIQTSSSGTTSVLAADRWFETVGSATLGASADGLKGPSVLFVSGGKAAELRPDSMRATSNNFIVSYTIEVQPRDTVAIMVLTQASTDPLDAQTIELTFGDLAALYSAHLLTNLPVPAYKILNWSGPGWAHGHIPSPNHLPRIDADRVTRELQ
jgi:hypothetical protein